MSWDDYDYSKININNKHVKLVYCAYTQVIIIIMIYNNNNKMIYCI